MQRAVTVILCFAYLVPATSAGSWSTWGQWTRCSRTCSQGTQYRIRHCFGGIPGTHGCYGSSWMSRMCYIAYTCATTTTTTTISTTTLSQSCFDPINKDSYRGPISQTETGIVCQEWGRQFPHQHKFTPDRYPASDLTSNRCRNPDKDKRPWCFTTSKLTQWDFCSVPKCSEVGVIHPSTSLPGSSSIPPGTSGCGVPDVPMSDEQPIHIVGGVEAPRGSLPWQASLRRSFTGSHFCGASLIKKSWLLTAAHCITEPRNPSSYYGILGDHFQFTRDDTEKRVDFSAIFRHERYDTTTLENDITLMKLKTPVSYNSYIKPVCLPAENAMLPNNEMVTVSGWGATKGTGSNAVLNRASVPIVSNSQCNSLLGGIAATMLCAGYMEGGKDSCQGDSGGPLVWKSNSGSYQLVGIVSWGYGCAEARKPGVYTRVSNYLGWINNVINRN